VATRRHTTLSRPPAAQVPDFLCILAPGLSFYISLFGLRVYAKRIATQRGLAQAQVFFSRGLCLSGAPPRPHARTAS